jgi:thiol-disulfide isomerase/thioredoxin
MELNKLNLGNVLPNFSLPGVDGFFFSTKSISGEKIVLIIFSCNHCPYVQAYEERIIQLQKDYSDKGLVIVAINSNDEVKYPEDSLVNMQLRAKEKSFNFLYLRDETQEIAKLFGAASTPEIFLFNKEKILAYIGKIDDNWSQPERVKQKYLNNAIEEILNGNEVSVPETFAIGCSIKWKK